MNKLLSIFQRKKVIDTSLWVDVHSHLIPGIDDGASDIEESMKLIHALVALGYNKIITTPHIMHGQYANTPTNIKIGLELLKQRIYDEKIDVKIEAAAEYYLDEGFLNHLFGNDILTIDGSYILFETSYSLKPLYFESMVYEMSASGYKPLLAHPERYRYIRDYSKDYIALKEMGIYFQVNINSFGGHYGKDAQKKALFLSKHGMIDVLGTDAHHIKQLESIKNLKNKRVYLDIFKRNKILNNTF